MSSKTLEFELVEYKDFLLFPLRTSTWTAIKVQITIFIILNFTLIVLMKKAILNFKFSEI